MNLNKDLTITELQNLITPDGDLNMERIYVTFSAKKELSSKFKVNTFATKEDILEYIKKYDAKPLYTLDYNTIVTKKTRLTRRQRPPETSEEYYASTFYFEIDDNLYLLTLHKENHHAYKTLSLYHPVNEHTVSEELEEWACSFENPSNSSKVSFISLQGNYWDMEEVDVTDTPTIDFNLNYNDDFDHDKVTKLVNDGTRGLILLGGAAGSGKTNYLRWLMAHSDKKFVYMPANQISLMSSPSFISFALTSLKDCILLMEDCEEALIERAAMKGGEVQTILNLSDGIIGSALNLTIIGTYNTKDNIDKALFRKGRLLYMYDFTELKADKATKLSETLGHKIVYDKPQVLSEIYNPAPNMVEKTTEAKFGFKIGA
jgi:hypothetical protein